MVASFENYFFSKNRKKFLGLTDHQLIFNTSTDKDAFALIFTLVFCISPSQHSWFPSYLCPPKYLKCWRFFTPHPGIKIPLHWFSLFCRPLALQKSHPISSLHKVSQKCWRFSQLMKETRGHWFDKTRFWIVSENQCWFRIPDVNENVYAMKMHSPIFDQPIGNPWPTVTLSAQKRLFI